MLNDLNYLELEDIEHRLYSQLHHSTCAEEDVAPLDLQPEMPRRNVSYRPVRYFLRKNINPPRPKEQAGIKTVNSEDKQTPKDVPQVSENVVHSYPINNILVLPQNSDALINVISQDRKLNKILRRLNSRRKRKEKQKMKKLQKEQDIKPIVSEIKIGKRVPNVNRHTIILSDSEDDAVVIQDTPKVNKMLNIGKDKEIAKGIRKNVNNSVLTTSNATNSSTDDDVILVETQTENEIIEIDDTNVDQWTKTHSSNLQYKPNERNELLSTPESSTSNDFLENAQLNPNPNFNFALHGPEFKDSEFLRPTVPVDISESGSVSSISDVSISMRANVFNVVDFPKEKENLFDENNLEKFKNSITPQRSSRKGNVEANNSVRNAEVEFGDRQKNLPTLSDIQGVDHQEKRERGRSIIRELVNDRAYVLLSSQQKKKTKKRKPKDGESDNERIVHNSPELVTKKKKKKAKKKDSTTAEDGSDLYVEFTDDLEKNGSISSSPVPRDISENKKSKKKRQLIEVEQVEDCGDKNLPVKLMVRTDLFPGYESDNSVHCKKSKKKKKLEQHIDSEEVLEEHEQKKKTRKPDKVSEESVEIATDPHRRKKKEKSVSECSSSDINITGKRKRNIESDKNAEKDIKEEENSLNIIEDSEGNETKKKRKKKRSTSEVEIIDNVDNTATCKNVEEISTAKSKKECTSGKEGNENYSSEAATSISLNETSTEVLEPKNCETILSNPDKIKKKGITSENEDCPLSVEERQTPKINSDVEFTQNEETSVDVRSNPKETSILENSHENLHNNDKTIEKASTPILNEQSNKSIFPEISSNAPLGGANPIKVVESNIQGPEKSQSVWNMCSTKFFSSCESLFVVSNIHTVVEPQNISENIEQVIESGVNDDSGVNDESSNMSKVSVVFPFENFSEFSVVDPKVEENLENTAISTCNFKNIQSTQEDTALSTSIQPESAKDIASTPEVNKDKESPLPIAIEVKIEKEINDTNILSEPVSSEKQTATQKEAPKTQESEEISSPYQEVTVKVEPATENTGICIIQSNQNLDSNIHTESIITSSTETVNTSIEKQKLPDIIENLVKEKDSVQGMRKLCEFLEQVTDPNDVLKKVSMMKQAFLEKSVSARNESFSTVVRIDDNDDILSISSNDSSIICLDNDTTFIHIEDDITLANCEADNSYLDKEVTIEDEETACENVGQLEVSEQEKTCTPVNTSQSNHSIEKDKSNHQKDFSSRQMENEEEGSAQAATNYLSRRGHIEDYIRGLDNFEVETIQRRMSNDPKLWKISPADLPNRRPPPKGKRCIKCRDFGHLGHNCPNKSALPKCYLCGVEGHLDFKCPNKLCTQCGRSTSIMQSVCQHCRLFKNIICSICKNKGHPRTKCPDLWRRYHLTVDHGPLVQSDGMKLKPREDLWCSSCSRSGHLEHYCHLARRNMNFQQLDPTIHYYSDVYNEGFRLENACTSGGTIVSKKVLERLQAHLDNPPKETNNSSHDDLANVPTNDVVQRESCSLNSSQTKGSTPLNEPSTSSDSSTILNSSIVSVSNSGLAELPEDFFVIDEVGDAVLNQKFQHVNSADSIEKSNYERANSARISERESSSQISRSETSRREFHSPHTPSNAMESSVEDDNFFDPQFFFMHSELGQAKDFVRKELELLHGTQFKVKNFYYRFFAYEEDNRKPLAHRKIPLSKKRKFYKELNMLIFGREGCKGGIAHLAKLKVFVTSPVGEFTQHMRETMSFSYNFIFKDMKHNHANYPFFIRSLIKKYGNGTI